MVQTLDREDSGINRGALSFSTIAVGSVFEMKVHWKLRRVYRQWEESDLYIALLAHIHMDAKSFCNALFRICGPCVAAYSPYWTVFIWYISSAAIVIRDNEDTDRPILPMKTLAIELGGCL